MPPTPTPIVIDPFSNESRKTKTFNNIDQDKMVVLEALIKAIEGVELYDPVRAT